MSIFQGKVQRLRYQLWNVIVTASVSVEELDSVEDAPVRYASLCSMLTCLWF